MAAARKWLMMLSDVHASATQLREPIQHRIRELYVGEELHLERWITAVMRGWKVPDDIRTSWQHSIRQRRARVLSIEMGLSITIIAPRGVTLKTAIVWTVSKWVPILKTMHHAIMKMTDIQRDCHIVFIADKQYSRRLPVLGSPILPEHVNGGLTELMSFQREPSSWQILVYRWDDATKVLVHELLHLHRLSMEMIMTDENHDPIVQEFLQRHRIALHQPIRRININEALTEVMALHLLCAWVSGHSGSSWSELKARVCHENDRLAYLFAMQFPGWLQHRSWYQDGTHSFAYVMARAALWMCDLTQLTNIYSIHDLMQLLDVMLPDLYSRLNGMTCRKKKHNRNRLLLTPTSLRNGH